MLRSDFLCTHARGPHLPVEIAITSIVWFSRLHIDGASLEKKAAASLSDFV